MRRRPSGVDNLAGLFSDCLVHVRPGMDDEQNNVAGKANRLPTIPIRVRVRTAFDRVGQQPLRCADVRTPVPQTAFTVAVEIRFEPLSSSGPPLISLGNGGGSGSVAACDR